VIFKDFHKICYSIFSIAHCQRCPLSRLNWPCIRHSKSIAEVKEGSSLRVGCYTGDHSYRLGGSSL